LKHVGRKKWGTLDPQLWVCKAPIRLLHVAVPFESQHENASEYWAIVCQGQKKLKRGNEHRLIELQVLAAWKNITDTGYVFNSQELWHFTSGKAHGNSEFLVKFLGRIFQFCMLASPAATLLFITFQITLQDILGDYENSEH